MNDLALTLKIIADKAKKCIQQCPSTIPIIAIAGGPGSGKSYLAKQLHTTLEKDGFKGLIIEQDNFSHHDGDTSANLLHINPHLKWQLIHQVMQDIASGKQKITLPVRIRNHFPYTPQTPLPYTIETKIIDLSNIDFIIFEGAHALSGPETYDFFKYCTFGIFIDVSQENMQTWRMEREMAKPSHLQRPAQIFDLHMNLGMEIYHTYVLPTKENAFFIMYKKDKDEYSLQTR